MKKRFFFHEFGLSGQLTLEYLIEKLKPDLTQFLKELEKSKKDQQKTLKKARGRKRNPYLDSTELN